jgi:probable glucuronoxylan glucuronosyltransferase IRX7
MHNSIFLSHLGDLNMGCFQTHRDIVIPPYISSDRIRTAWKKNSQHDDERRNILAHFRGTVYWQHETPDPSLLIKSGKSDLYSYGVRQYLLEHFKDDKDVKVYEGGSEHYVEEVLSSKFCLCPRGFAPWSRRLFDAVQLGCIPVIIADGIELPYEEFLDYTSFSVKIAEVEVSKLKQILLGIPESTIRKKREVMWNLKTRFLFHKHESNDDAFDMILWKLRMKAVSFRPVAGREYL